MRRMRRIGRWMFNAAAAMSLVMCVSITLLWVRGYSACDFFWRSVPDPRPAPGWVNGRLIWNTGGWASRTKVISNHGWLSVKRSMEPMSLFPPPFDPSDAWPRWGHKTLHIPGLTMALGDLPWFRVYHRTPVTYGVAIYLRFWMVDALAALFPIAWIVERRLRRRVQNNSACRKCGYDLTGNVSGVCPECGTAIAPVEGGRR